MCRSWPGISKAVVNLLMLSRVEILGVLPALWQSLCIIILTAIRSVVLFAWAAVDGFTGVAAHCPLGIHVYGHAGAGWDHWSAKPPD